MRLRANPADHPTVGGLDRETASVVTSRSDSLAYDAGSPLRSGKASRLVRTESGALRRAKAGSVADFDALFNSHWAARLPRRVPDRA